MLDDTNNTIVKLSVRELETIIKEYYATRNIVAENIDFETNLPHNQLQVSVDLNVGRVRANSDGNA